MWCQSYESGWVIFKLKQSPKNVGGYTTTHIIVLVTGNKNVYKGGFTCLKCVNSEVDNVKMAAIVEEQDLIYEWPIKEIFVMSGNF